MNAHVYIRAAWTAAPPMVKLRNYRSWANALGASVKMPLNSLFRPNHFLSMHSAWSIIIILYLPLLPRYIASERVPRLSLKTRKGRAPERSLESYLAKAWSLVYRSRPFLSHGKKPAIVHERTTTAKNMGILKYHQTSLISYERGGPWHAWTVLSNTKPGLPSGFCFVLICLFLLKFLYTS
jgi:hypothetical protein